MSVHSCNKTVQSEIWWKVSDS